MRVCLVTANLGGMDKDDNHTQHVTQVLPDGWVFHHFHYDDTNTTRRDRAMRSRLQAKISRTHAMELHPAYDIYLWMDSSLVMSDPRVVTWAVDQFGSNDICMFRHPNS